MTRNLSGVQTPGTYELTRSVADHEVFIIFDGDADALDFREWLDEKGWDLFAEWNGERR